MFSVKWYEPLRPGPKREEVRPGLTLPAGRGWHEQAVTTQDQAWLLEDALRRKGFALVEVHSTPQCGVLVDEWCDKHGARHGYCP